MRIGGLQQCSLIDYPGTVSAVVFTIGCNFRCPYCHNPELVDETADTVSETKFFQFLERRVGKLDGVVISGGEPTVHDDLLSFMERIKAYGFRIKLDSNGTRSDVLARAIDQKLVDYIAMDIKAPLSSYERVVARPVDVHEIRKSIALLISERVEYEFRTTVIQSLISIEDFHDIGREIAGAKRYYLQRFVPTKLLNPAFRKKTTYSDKAFETIRTLMNTYVTSCHIR